MSSQKKIGLAIFAALAIGVSGYFGYQHFSSVPTGASVSAVEKIGIIDLTRAIKAHPRAGELEAIELEMAEIQQDVQQKIKRGMAMTMSTGLPMEISNSMIAGEQALRTEANQKIAAKQTEISKRLAESELTKKKAIDEELEEQYKQISEEYKMRLVNLDLKINAVNMSDEEREEKMAEKEALVWEAAAKKNKIAYESEQKLAAEMQSEYRAANEEMHAYVQQISEEYGVLTAAKSEQANAEMMAKLQKVNRQIEEEVEASKEVFAEKKKQHEEIKNVILQDIEAKVAGIAEKQGVTVVMREVRMNLTAVDITDEVITACKAQQQ